ncbi:uncharacterized protein L3040_008621 [Drepanopeziza brunnea f. sp. 'multigermtubi']|uniref:Proteophosphoglycan 5 n=1 Tax=Marssonina brunnea f. sp. multigermtubi (strain MB_m1) TaxID=1072389 RepID=K1WKY1_MARBU|nr:proteophosphoglycan 5 [Drepanopeziza brunnea f. sp. 'multigermtubi' MB_m1]EKD13511.1 proteophosphoglycan 5 [Drepanopeziza brunnea f. sp. 'multigermtubi' MB_m1]KAJ5033506.1 hypothetical protein L3040_008621 [Drepanopeziza brunnea f. sp. 'multigermtubi']
MSSSDLPPTRHRRQTRSAVMPCATASSQAHQNPRNPQSPHHLNLQAHAQNTHADMNSDLTLPPARPSTPPRTPRKESRPSSSQNTSTAPEIGSKQRSRNKNRPKNVMTSPGAVRKGRNTTPPLTGAQYGAQSSSKPVNTPTAYAGSTFHASPAPSALPIPSFYSKSVPDSPGFKGLKSLTGAALPTASSTPPRTFPPREQAREESPLDVFFKADREEKARARSASSNKAFAAANGPFPPPLESSRSAQTLPTRSQQNSQTASKRMSSNGIFVMEMDGDRASGTPLGPAFSTPYSERINAARSRDQSGVPIEGVSHGSQLSLERSEALKAYLFSNQSAPLVANPTSPLVQNFNAYEVPSAPGGGPRSAGLPGGPYYNDHAPDPNASNDGPRAGGRSSGLRQEVTNSRTPMKMPDRSQSYGHSPVPSRNAPSNAYGGNNYATQFTSRTPYQASASPIGILPVNPDPRIQGMEDSLRKILKLDSDASPGTNTG